jgi:hypothetical protein
MQFDSEKPDKIRRGACACNDDKAEGYEIISRRIEALVHDGRLLAHGDTKNWRCSEVRLKPN